MKSAVLPFAARLSTRVPKGRRKAATDEGRFRPMLIRSILMIMALFCQLEARAQQPAPTSVQTHVVTPEEQKRLSSPDPATPPVGKDVMTPTRDGMRFTPDLARAFALGWINQNLQDRVDLTKEQTQQFSEAIAHRMRDLALSDPHLTQKLFETAIETMIKTEGNNRKITPELARNLSETVTPVLPTWHKFLDGIREDGRISLDAAQQKQLERVIHARHHLLDRLGERMQHWADGQFNDDDRQFLDKVFDEPEDLNDAPASPAGSAASPVRQVDPAARRRVRQARRSAEWEVSRVGPAEWQRFVNLVKTTMKFTPEQAGKADQLLTEYRAKAEPIMTPEWRRSIRENRARNQLRWNLQAEPTGPWLFHLDRQFQQLVEPLRRLQGELYDKILELATDEQRTAIVDDVATKAAQHGLPMSEADRAVLIAALK